MQANILCSKHEKFLKEMLCINILQNEHFPSMIIHMPSVQILKKKKSKAVRIGTKITTELGVSENLKEAVKMKIK